MKIYLTSKIKLLSLIFSLIWLGFLEPSYAAPPKKSKAKSAVVVSKSTPLKKLSKAKPQSTSSKTSKKALQPLAKLKKPEIDTVKIKPKASIALPIATPIKTKTKTKLPSSPLSQNLATQIRRLIPRNIHSVVSEFEQKLLKTLSDKHIPGCAVAIVYKNEIVFMHGYGVRTLGKPEKIDVDTIFQLASVSKPISATLTALLEQRGLLNVNDPVSRYLPNFSLNAPKNADSLKIKHVLSHSSGLPRSGFDHLIETFAPHSKLIRMLQTTRVTAAIGKRYDYHNAMFSLINEIVLAATRHSFQDCLSTYLLKPLNMNNTSTTYAALLANPNRAFPHIQSTKNKMIPAATYSTGYYSVAPAGGINSSIRDMAIFLKAQLGGYPGVVNQSVLARLHEPLVPTPSKSLSPVNGARDKIKNSSYGLGWRLIDFNQKKMVYHAGWVKGFKNFIAFIPEEQVGIVVLHNSEIKFSPRLAMQFFDMYFSAF